MNQLIVTGDETNCSFLVYDLKHKQLHSAKHKQPELESKLIDQGRPAFRPFGISTQNENLFIASNDIIGVFDKSTLNFIRTLTIPAFVNTHQILCDGDYIFVTNAANDSIGIHNLKTNESKFLQFPDLTITNSVRTPSDAYELDTVHVNSLYKDGDLLYYCLHNKSKGSSFGYLNLETNESSLLFNAGIAAHNIRIIDNKLYSLSTGSGDIIQVDLFTLKPSYYHIVDPKVIFLRGLENYGNELLIACSNKYENPNPTTSHLLKFNPKLNTIDPFMDLPEVPFITDIHLV